MAEDTAIPASPPEVAARPRKQTWDAELGDCDGHESDDDEHVEQNLPVALRDRTRSTRTWSMQSMRSSYSAKFPKPFAFRRHARACSSTLRRKVQWSLAFEDHSLLRGCETHHVLKRYAEVLGDSPCKADDHLLSHSVDHIDAFISHNWAAPRRQKFFALALHFNLSGAVAASSAVCAIMFLLTVFGLMPTTQVLDRKGVTNTLGVGCQCCCAVTFCVMMMVWHDIRPWLGLRGPKVFLDKICVHQTDPVLKQRGIEHLAEFLSYSWSLVVLYSDLYLDKLWTVYEFATFLLMFPGGQIHVQPLSLAKALLLGLIITTLNQGALVLYWHPSLSEWHSMPAWEARLPVAVSPARMAMIFPTTAAFALLCRHMAAEQAAISARVASFSISRAQCLSEDDRSLVEGNIAKLAVHCGVSDGDSTEETLRAFDEFVHEEVPRALASSWGRVGFHYYHISIIFLHGWAYLLDTYSGRLADIIHGGRQPDFLVEARFYVAMLAWTVATTSALCPLCAALVFTLARWTLRFQGHWLLQCLVCIVVAVPPTLLFDDIAAGILGNLYQEALRSTASLVELCAVALAALALTLLVYSRPKTSKCRQRLDAVVSEESHDSQDTQCSDSLDSASSEGSASEGDRRA